MKKQLLLILFLSSILFSCLKEKSEVNYYEDDHVYLFENRYKKYYGNNKLKYGIQYKAIDRGLNYFLNPELYFKYYDAGLIKNGRLILNFPNIDELHCEEIGKELMLSSFKRITNLDAKIKIIQDYNINVFNDKNEEIGFLGFGDPLHGGEVATIYFIYSTHETEILGENDFEEFNLFLKKGWNKIYCFSYNFLFWKKIENTTSRKFFPNGKKWEIIIIKPEV
jgi:hypothetical protein